MILPEMLAKISYFQDEGCTLIYLHHVGSVYANIRYLVFLTNIRYLIA